DPTTSPPLPVEGEGEELDEKTMLLSEWKEQLDKLDSDIDLLGGKNEAKSVAAISLNDVSQAESTITTSPHPVTIPDACTPEEIRELERLERANKELRKLREEMEALWLRPVSPESMMRRHLREQRHQFSISGLLEEVLAPGTPEERRARLERKKEELNWRINRLERNIKYYERIGWDRCGAGPCNNLGDGPSRLPGIPMRMYRAMHGGMYDNMCNLLTEIRRIVERVNVELGEIVAESNVLLCENTVNFQSPI
ncbi:hypothetical protein QAD02_001077, partial [Eretmocerus hayati]